MKKIHIYLLIGLLFLGACEDEKSVILPPSNDPEMENSTEPDPGDADFTKYIAIGNSLTAGYMDGALYNRGQANAFPNILSAQFSQVGGGDFNQPDIDSENGYFSTIGTNIFGRLKLNANSIPSPTTPGELPKAYTGDKSTLNNFGVQNVRTTTILSPRYGDIQNGNPYYSRFASKPGTSSLIEDIAQAMKNGGTFFTIWLGSNDILGYATEGADDTRASYTDLASFETSYRIVVDSILKASPSSKGLITNIPSITSIPYFTYIKYNDFKLSVTQAEQANALYQRPIDSVVATGVITIGIVTTQILPQILNVLKNNGVDTTGLQNSYSAAFTAAFVENSSDPDPQSPDPAKQPIFDNITMQVVLQLMNISTQKGIQDQVKAYLNDPTNTNFSSIHVQVTAQINVLKAGGFYPELKGCDDNDEQCQSEPGNPFIIVDETSPTTIRYAKEGELILLSASVVITSGPLENRYVLTADEISTVSKVLSDFNEIIKKVADENSDRIVFVDMLKIYDEIRQNGVQTYKDIIIDPTFTPPFGMFSLDGIHPNGRGSSVVANIFIEAINKKFNANIPFVNINIHPGNDFPE